MRYAALNQDTQLLGRYGDFIPDGKDFRELPDWCGLRFTEMTPAEMETLTATTRSPQAGWVTKLFEKPEVAIFGWTAEGAREFRWVRIHHRTDSNQWIAIAIREAMLMTGRRPFQVICLRVPVGFQPPPEPVQPKT